MLFSFGLLMSNNCFATDSTTGAQSVTYTIPAVSVFTISGDVSFGTFGTPAAGSDFAQIGMNNSLTYSVTNNAGSGSCKITAQLGAALPSGIGLVIGLVAPSGAGSNGPIGPSAASATTYVTGISNGAFQTIKC